MTPAGRSSSATTPPRTMRRPSCSNCASARPRCSPARPRRRSWWRRPASSPTAPASPASTRPSAASRLQGDQEAEDALPASGPVLKQEFLGLVDLGREIIRTAKIRDAPSSSGGGGRRGCHPASTLPFSPRIASASARVILGERSVRLGARRAVPVLPPFRMRALDPGLEQRPALVGRAGAPAHEGLRFRQRQAREPAALEGPCQNLAVHRAANHDRVPWPEGSSPRASSGPATSAAMACRSGNTICWPINPRPSRNSGMAMLMALAAPESPRMR